VASLSSIGVSGLLAFQQSLGTVSHNISNSTTEGFSRQRVGLTTRVPENTGAGFFGTGVRVDNVTRVYDQFILDRLQRSEEHTSELQSLLPLVFRFLL